VEHLLGILANPLRFHILCALTYGAFTVGELVELCGANLSNVSQQLKLMWLGGMVSKEKRGKTVHYALADQRIEKLISVLETLFRQ